MADEFGSKAIIDAKNDGMEGCLYFAASRGDNWAVKHLIAMGADVNALSRSTVVFAEIQ